MLDRFSVWLFSNYSILIIAILIVGVFSVMLCYSRRLKISEILIIASLSGMSVASRIVILIPFFKPCTALIIIAGSAYGPAIGGMVGMLISNHVKMPMLQILLTFTMRLMQDNFKN